MASTSQITIRETTVDDIPVILSLIRELAEYEKLSHEVKADEAQLKKTLFGDHKVAYCYLAEIDNQAVGFMLYFFNYSTFLAKPGIYLEDLYVKPEFRSHGIGKILLDKLKEIARENDCGRIEWWVLDWNKPAIDFYERIGAEAMLDWTVYRLKEEQF